MPTETHIFAEISQTKEGRECSKPLNSVFLRPYYVSGARVRDTVVLETDMSVPSWDLLSKIV